MTALTIPTPARLAARGPAQLHVAAPQSPGGHRVSVLVREVGWNVVWALEAMVDGVSVHTRSGHVTVAAGYRPGRSRARIAAPTIVAHVAELLLEFVADADGAPVTITAPRTSMREELVRALAARPQVEFATGSRITSTEPSYQGACDRVHALAESARGRLAAGTFVVATDASVRRGRKGAGVAWVGPDGRHATTVLNLATTLAAEIGAYVLAAEAHAGHVEHLHILTDSSHAMDTAARALASGEPTHFMREVHSQLVNLLRASEPLRITFERVQGHTGHELNTAADRLAVLARRSHDAEIDADLRVHLSYRAVAETLTEAA